MVFVPKKKECGLEKLWKIPERVSSRKRFFSNFMFSFYLKTTEKGNFRVTRRQLRPPLKTPEVGVTSGGFGCACVRRFTRFAPVIMHSTFEDCNLRFRFVTRVLWHASPPLLPQNTGALNKKCPHTFLNPCLLPLMPIAFTPNGSKSQNGNSNSFSFNFLVRIVFPALWKSSFPRQGVPDRNSRETCGTNNDTNANWWLDLKSKNYPDVVFPDTTAGLILHPFRGTFDPLSDNTPIWMHNAMRLRWLSAN